MGTDKHGRWKADPLEPFPRGIHGMAPELIRDSMRPENDGRNLVILWIGAIGTLALGVFGRSILLIGFGVLASALAILWTRSRHYVPHRRRKPHGRAATPGDELGEV
jgi:hypothetical protein